MNEQYMITIDERAWRVSCVQDGGNVTTRSIVVPEKFDLGEIVQSASQMLTEMGHASQSICLAVASPWCLCRRIDTSDIRRSERHVAIGFALEEHLPVSAEQMVADCIALDSDEALGVCAEYEKLRSIVDALRAADMQVQHICPHALLAAGFVVSRLPQADALLIRTGEPKSYDWIEFQHGKPATWRWLADDVDAVQRLMSAHAKNFDHQRIVATLGDVSDCRLAAASERVTLEKVSNTDAEQAVASEAAAVLDGRAVPWIDWCRDRLGGGGRYAKFRRPMGWLAASVALLLMSIIAASQWRAMRYEHQGNQFVEEQTQVFKHALPGQRVPVYILGRLQSEQRKLTGLGGGQADSSMHITSALAHLQHVLEPLPADLPFRLLDVSIEPGFIRIDGQAAGHAQAEQLASALRQAGVYDVDAPKTQLMKDQGVSFLFTAKPHPMIAEKGTAQ